MLLRGFDARAEGYYIQQVVWQPPGPLLPERVRLAWEIVTRRFDALRLEVDWTEATAPRQRVVPTFTPIMAEAPAGLETFLASDRRRGFSCDTEALWRVALLTQPDGASVLVWTFHHVLLDGRSTEVVFTAWKAVYLALATGQPLPAVPTAARGFADFLAWRATATFVGAEAYWKERLAGWGGPLGLPPVLSLEADTTIGTPAEGATLLSVAATEAIREGARRQGVTMNNLVQGALLLTLMRYHDTDDACVGVVRAGRHWGTDGEPSQEAGMFIQTVPFRARVGPSETVGPWLRGLREQQQSARLGEFASPQAIRTGAGLSAGVSLHEVVLIFDRVTLPPDCTLLERPAGLSVAAYDGEQLRLVVAYPPHRHTGAQIDFFLGHLQSLILELAAAGEGQPVAALRMAGPDELQRIHTDWQGPVVPLSDRPIHRWIEAQAARTPSAIAVEHEAIRMTYARLNAEANQLARRLRELKASDRPIAVVLDRSQLQVVTWLALLKAGLIYAPVDPGNPEARLRFYFSDLNPAVIVTQQSLAALLPADCGPLLFLDAPEEEAGRRILPAENLPEGPSPDAPAFLIYTSGSTGLPKACVNTYRGLNNFRLALAEWFQLTPGDRVLQISPTSFDMSLLDYLPPLLVGATLVVPSTQRVATGPSLGQFLAEARITFLAVTPTRLRGMPLLPLPGLRWVAASGEALPAALVAPWGRGRLLTNCCGPAECSVLATAGYARLEDFTAPIGRLLPNFLGLVLDDQKRPVSVGVPGDLFLGGPGIGAGYWRRPDLTAERFVHGLPGFPEERFYATGDRVRWLPDGRLDFLGRRDNQVKFRGARVELGEIEATLEQHPGVRVAAVRLIGDQLHAWVETRPPGASPEELRDWLSGRLQQMFVPASLTVLTELPRTISGKVNRQALPVPVAEPPGPFGSGRIDPASRAWLEAGNLREIPFPRQQSVVDFIAEQARLRPTATALEAEEQSLTFGELESLARGVARRLLADGLAAEEPVALLFSRCPGFVVAALGVLQAGGSYVALDPAAPENRLAFQLGDCGARRVIAPPGTTAPLAGVKFFTADGPVGPVGESNVAPADPARRAYLVYTSGSTGRPKAVEVEHHSLTNLVCHYHRKLGFSPVDRVTFLAHPTFDASVADLWPALCAGGTVVIPPPATITDPDALIAWLKDRRITFTFIPTALAALMFGRPWPPGMALRHLATGGEALLVRPPAALPFEVLNTYGPTENTVDSTWAVVSSAGHGPPLIGRPIANVGAYVLDEEQRLVPPGAEGELVLGGEGVARGYLNQPEMTRSAFLPDPFSPTPGARMYRTGDRVRWASGGELEFLGRRDGQVQIAGRRVELGEIESCLRGGSGVREVCCLPVSDGATVRGVMAHVESSAPASLLRPELVARAAAELPDYMRPLDITIYQHLPRTPAGKLDRVNLAKSRPARIPAPVQPAGPAASLEESLAALWHGLLPGASAAPATATFWNLGGDSLAAVQLALGIHQLTGRKMPVSALLQEATFEGMRRSVRRGLLQDDPDVVVFRESGHRPPLFCLFGIHGDVDHYQQLAEALGSDQPVYGLRLPAAYNASALPATMARMAAEASAQIRRVTADPAPALLGFSWSGLLAFEVARQWPGTGRSFIGMIGSSAPIPRQTVTRRLGHFLRELPPWLGRAFRERQHWSTRLGRFGGVLKRTGAALWPKAAAGPAMPDWAAHPVAQSLIRMGFDYRPEVARPMPLHLFRETQDFGHGGKPFEPHDLNHLWDGGWTPWAKCPPHVHWIPGSHRSILCAPEVGVLAAELRAAMDTHYLGRNI